MNIGYFQGATVLKYNFTNFKTKRTYS